MNKSENYGRCMRSLMGVCLVLALGLKSAHAERLDAVSSFAYQLQNTDVAALAASSFDLIVMDYSHDGDASSEFTAAEIQQLKDAGKIVLAYLSIGEAEDYRFYFKSRWLERALHGRCEMGPSAAAPAWLELPNPDYCSNYKTRFWQRGWQRVIYGRASGTRESYLDRIVDAGFSGVYLDIIDGYEYWLRKRRPHRRPTAASDMARFVISIAKYARETRAKTDFFVVPQNGSGILSRLSPTVRAEYLAAIDGIGAEDTYFFGDADEDNDLDVQEAARQALLTFGAAGKKVLTIDYLTDPTKIVDFKSRACADGFIPQVSRRSLDSLGDLALTGCF